MQSTEGKGQREHFSVKFFETWHEHDDGFEPDANSFNMAEAYAEAYSRRGAGPTAQDNAIEAANDRVAQHERDKPHETVPVKVWADIDVEMSPHVAYLNTIEGLRTHASCQGMEHGPHPYEAYIMASWPESAEAELRERYTIEPLGKSWGYLHPIASKSGLLSGAGSPEETKPIKCSKCGGGMWQEYGVASSTVECMSIACEGETVAIRGAASSSQGAEPTEKCGDEFKLRDGYFCEMPKGHEGDHEAECPNPQFTQRWPVSEGAPEPPSQPACPGCGSLDKATQLRVRFEWGAWVYCNHDWHMAGRGSTGERAEPSADELAKTYCNDMIDTLRHNVGEERKRRAALAEGSRTQGEK